MKIIVDSTEKEGLEAFLGKKIEVWCDYIYVGTLIGVNEKCIKLDGKDAAIVYETGPLTDKQYKDVQPLGRDCYVMCGSIQSFGAAR